MKINSIKKILLSLLYVIIFIAIIKIFINIKQHFHFDSYESSINKFFYFLFLSIYPILLGIYFSIPRIIEKTKTNGKWVIEDKVKLISMSLPLCIINFLPFLIFSFSDLTDIFTPFLFYIHPKLLGNEPETIRVLTGTLLGFIIAESMQKRQYRLDANNNDI